MASSVIESRFIAVSALKDVSRIHLTQLLAVKQYLRYFFWSRCDGREEGFVRLTIYTDYALRLMMYLALKDGAVATISEVASSYGISRNHLMKVAYELGAAGYIESTRGRRGGMWPVKPA